MASLMTSGGAPVATAGFITPAILGNTQASRARVALQESSAGNGETTPVVSTTCMQAAGIAAFAVAFGASGRHRRATATQGAALKTVPMAGVTAPRSSQQHHQQQKNIRGARMIVCAGSELPEGRKLRVAVVGGGPGGASCADSLAKAGIETYLIERKLDNCKPCGGAIPLCMLEEFDLPTNIVDRKVRKMTMISPTNKEVQIGSTLKDDEFIGMVRREVLDDFLRQRAQTNGATVINGLFMGMTMPQSKTEPYVLTYNNLNQGTKGEKCTLEVDVVIGGDGANSRVAKAIEAGDYEYAIAFQERMRIPEDKMEYYKERAEMYVGEDVSPDFYAWVFPKCDHVAVGTGTVVDKKGIQKYQQGIRDRAKSRIEGGEILRVEAHPIPEHPRPRRVNGRAALIGDAAGYVTKCSGEGIYFAAKSGRMCAEIIAERSRGGTRMLEDYDLYEYCRQFDDKYGATYLVLDQLQKVFYTSDAARESFVELCEEEYVQKVTFDSYLYKQVQGNDPIGDLKLGIKTFQSLWKNNFSKPEPMRELA